MEDITAHHFGLGASGHGHGHLPWSSSSLSAVVAPPPQQQQQHQGYLAPSPLSLNTAAPSHGNPVLQLANGSLLDACAKAKEPYAADVEAIKAKIISHPIYPSLLAAYLDCLKASCSSLFDQHLLKFILHLMSKREACMVCLPFQISMAATVHACFLALFVSVSTCAVVLN